MPTSVWLVCPQGLRNSFMYFSNQLFRILAKYKSYLFRSGLVVAIVLFFILNSKPYKEKLFLTASLASSVCSIFLVRALILELRKIKRISKKASCTFTLFVYTVISSIVYFRIYWWQDQISVDEEMLLIEIVLVGFLFTTVILKIIEPKFLDKFKNEHVDGV